MVRIFRSRVGTAFLFPLLLLSFSVSTASSDPGPIRVQLDYATSDVTLSMNSNGDVVVRVRGIPAGGAAHESAPEALVYVAIPAGQAPVSVRVEGKDPIRLAGIEAGIDPARMKKWPGLLSTGEGAGEGWMRGNRLMALRLRPVAWNEGEGELVLWSRIQVVVEVAEAPVPPGIWQPERRFTKSEDDFKRLLRGIVANPEQIGNPPDFSTIRNGLAPNSISSDAYSPLFRPSADGSPVEYVIITSQELVPEYERLLEWRMKTGTTTAIRTVEWITDQYREGIDLPERIRRFIQDAASRWGTEWFLLGGDFDVIPMRYGKTRYYGGDDIPTELYYQCLDRNWNENGNALFGEGSAPDVGNLAADDVDLYPEVFVSRIPCSRAEGVRAVIDKTFQYERTPPTHPDYIPTFLGLAEVLSPSNWEPGDTVIFDGGILCEQAVEILPPSFRVVRMYENYQDPRFNGLAVPLRKADAIDSINAGFEIVHHVGHGYRNNLSVGEGGEEIIREDADQFMNKTEPFMFFGINCNSASIDYDSISEHFLCNPGGGCFAYLGSTRYDFPGSDDPYQNLFYQGLFDQMPISQAHALAKVPSIPSAQRDNPERWHQMSLVCYSEPLITIRSQTPRLLTVSHPASIQLGDSVMATVVMAGNPLEDARVTLYKPGDVFSTGTTGVDGTVTLACPADSEGLLSITATAYNAIPYEGGITVGPPGAAYLEVTSLRIGDSGTGNGDGRLDAGETADLLFTVRNTGSETATGISLTFSTGAAGLLILNPVTDLMDLAPGQVDSTFETQVIRVGANPGVVTALDVHGELLLTSSSGSRLDPVGLRVGGIRLWTGSQTVIDDPGGPGQDSVVAANETVQLHYKLLNQGLSAAQGVRLGLETTDKRVTLLNSEVDLGTIPGNGEAETALPLSFRVSDVSALPSIDLVLEANGVELSRRTIDVVRPVAPQIPTGRSRSASIVLSWNPAAGPNEDLRGYAVFRSLSQDGPFEQINSVTDSPFGYFEDLGLLPFTRYYYRLAAQDLSGNLSSLTEATGYSTSFPTLENWPLVRGGGTPSSPTIHDLNGDGVLEIIAAGEEIYVMHADGSEFLDGDRDSRTLGIFSQTNRATFWSTPAVADVDHDGILEIVAAGWASGKLYVFGADGVIQPGWPKSLGAPGGEQDAAYPWGSPLVADVDGDLDLEIFIPGGTFLYGFHHDGTEIRDGDANPATEGPFFGLLGGFNYGTPSAGDFDHDGLSDVVIGTRSGYLHILKGDGTVLFSKGFTTEPPEKSITGSPAIADLDQDGELEAIFPVRILLEVHAVNRFGASPPGWPVRISINQDLDASPTVADLNGDTFPDVVMAGGSGRLSIWRGQDGVLFPGFPFNMADLNGGLALSVRGTPCLGDVTGDSVPDILVGTQSASIYGVSITGQGLPGFPLKAEDNIEGGPLLWDVDGDGLTNLLFGSYDKRVYAYSTPGVFSPASCPWPMFRHDQRNSGFVATPITTPVEPALSSFQISMTPAGVELSWRAHGNAVAWAGWHVKRGETGRREGEIRLTEEPLSPGVDMKFVDVTALPGGTYRYTIEGVGRTGGITRFAPALFEVPREAPSVVDLRQNAPNPFRSTTSILFTQGGRSPSPVSLDVFDTLGRRVRSLANESFPPGTGSVTWDGRDDNGKLVPGGVYFYRLSAQGKSLTRKLTVVR